MNNTTIRDLTKKKNAKLAERKQALKQSVLNPDPDEAAKRKANSVLRTKKANDEEDASLSVSDVKASTASGNATTSKTDSTGKPETTSTNDSTTTTGNSEEQNGSAKLPPSSNPLKIATNMEGRNQRVEAPVSSELVGEALRSLLPGTNTTEIESLIKSVPAGEFDLTDLLIYFLPRYENEIPPPFLSVENIDVGKTNINKPEDSAVEVIVRESIETYAMPTSLTRWVLNKEFVDYINAKLKPETRYIYNNGVIRTQGIGLYQGVMGTGTYSTDIAHEVLTRAVASKEFAEGLEMMILGCGVPDSELEQLEWAPNIMHATKIPSINDLKGNSTILLRVPPHIVIGSQYAKSGILVKWASENKNNVQFGELRKVRRNGKRESRLVRAPGFDQVVTTILKNYKDECDQNRLTPNDIIFLLRVCTRESNCIIDLVPQVDNDDVIPSIPYDITQSTLRHILFCAHTTWQTEYHMQQIEKAIDTSLVIGGPRTDQVPTTRAEGGTVNTTSVIGREVIQGTFPKRSLAANVVNDERNVRLLLRNQLNQTPPATLMTVVTVLLNILMRPSEANKAPHDIYTYIQRYMKICYPQEHMRYLQAIGNRQPGDSIPMTINDTAQGTIARFFTIDIGQLRDYRHYQEIRAVIDTIQNTGFEHAVNEEVQAGMVRFTRGAYVIPISPANARAELMPLTAPVRAALNLLISNANIFTMGDNRANQTTLANQISGIVTALLNYMEPTLLGFGVIISDLMRKLACLPSATGLTHDPRRMGINRTKYVLVDGPNNENVHLIQSEQVEDGVDRNTVTLYAEDVWAFFHVTYNGIPENMELRQDIIEVRNSDLGVVDAITEHIDKRMQELKFCKAVERIRYMLTDEDDDPNGPQNIYAEFRQLPYLNNSVMRNQFGHQMLVREGFDGQLNIRGDRNMYVTSGYPMNGTVGLIRNEQIVRDDPMMRTDVCAVFTHDITQAQKENQRIVHEWLSDRNSVLNNTTGGLVVYKQVADEDETLTRANLQTPRKLTNAGFVRIYLTEDNTVVVASRNAAKHSAYLSYTHNGQEYIIKDPNNVPHKLLFVLDARNYYLMHNDNVKNPILAMLNAGQCAIHLPSLIYRGTLAQWTEEGLEIEIKQIENILLHAGTQGMIHNINFLVDDLGSYTYNGYVQPGGTTMRFLHPVRLEDITKSYQTIATRQFPNDDYAATVKLPDRDMFTSGDIENDLTTCDIDGAVVRKVDRPDKVNIANAITLHYNVADLPKIAGKLWFEPTVVA